MNGHTKRSGQVVKWSSGQVADRSGQVADRSGQVAEPCGTAASRGVIAKAADGIRRLHDSATADIIQPRAPPPPGAGPHKP